MIFEAANGGEVWPDLQSATLRGMVTRPASKAERRIISPALPRLSVERVYRRGQPVHRAPQKHIALQGEDRGMKWLHKAHREAVLRTPHPEPEGYATTQKSSTHILIEDGITLCQHKQVDGNAKRLVKPCTFL